MKKNQKPKEKSNLIYFPIRHNFIKFTVREDVHEYDLKVGDSLILKREYNPSEIKNDTLAISKVEDGYSIGPASPKDRDKILGLVVDYRRAM